MLETPWWIHPVSNGLVLYSRSTEGESNSDCMAGWFSFFGICWFLLAHFKKWCIILLYLLVGQEKIWKRNDFGCFQTQASPFWLVKRRWIHDTFLHFQICSGSQWPGIQQQRPRNLEGRAARLYQRRWSQQMWSKHRIMTGFWGLILHISQPRPRQNNKGTTRATKMYKPLRQPRCSVELKQNMVRCSWRWLGFYGAKLGHVSKGFRFYLVDLDSDNGLLLNPTPIFNHLRIYQGPCVLNPPVPSNCNGNRIPKIHTFDQALLYMSHPF